MMRQDKGVAATEEWREIAGYPCYKVSNLGRVKNVTNGRFLSTNGTDKDGYPVVSLTHQRKRRTFALHVLVCEAFNGHLKNALHKQVAHLDGTRTNARADNLKWVSRVENRWHQMAHGTNPAGEAHGNSKLTEADVIAIRAIGGRANYSALGRAYGVHRDTIREAMRGTSWRHVNV